MVLRGRKTGRVDIWEERLDGVPARVGVSGGDLGRSGDIFGCVVDLPSADGLVGVAISLGCKKPELGGVMSGVVLFGKAVAACNLTCKSFAASLPLLSALGKSIDTR